MKHELYHYGILGMHWGIRRYQNADGSLTPKGKKRYGYGTEIGSRGRKERAMDAADVYNRISTLKNMAQTDKRIKKIESLTTAYKGLVKDLDRKEVRYGELKYKQMRLANDVSWDAARVTNNPYVEKFAQLGSYIVFNGTAEGKELKALTRELDELNKKAILSSMKKSSKK